MVKNSFRYHLDHPSVTTDEYLESQHLEWGRAIMALTRIYLDTCYWVKLRDVKSGRVDDPELSALLSKLQAMVSSEKACCPITQTTSMELLRHEDASTRRATAELVDELSTGACLVTRADRLNLEMEYWVHSWLGYENRRPMEYRAWTKLGWVDGVDIPYETGLDPQQESAVQKAFADRMWTLPLAEATDVMTANIGEYRKLDEKGEFDRLARTLNESNRLHSDDCKSFPQIYRSELMSIVEEFAPKMIEIVRRERPNFTRRHQETRREFSSDPNLPLMSVFSEAIREPGLRQTLRTAHVAASCYASMRHDRRRKLTGNDLHDFAHAESAIAYCDFFLTERPLAALLNKGNLRLAADFPCKVFSSPADALRALS